MFDEHPEVDVLAVRDNVTLTKPTWRTGSQVQRLFIPIMLANGFFVNRSSMATLHWNNISNITITQIWGSQKQYAAYPKHLTKACATAEPEWHTQSILPRHVPLLSQNGIPKASYQGMCHCWARMAYPKNLTKACATAEPEWHTQRILPRHVPLLSQNGIPKASRTRDLARSISIRAFFLNNMASGLSSFGYLEKCKRKKLFRPDAPRLSIIEFMTK